MFRPSENIFDADRKLCGRTLADSRTPAKRIPPRTLPIWELSSEAFLVYIAAVLFYKPIFTQPLSFGLCAAGAVEKFATDRAVSVVYLRDTISISKINAAFLTGQQIDRIHVQQLLFTMFVCKPHNTQRLLLYHEPSNSSIDPYAKKVPDFSWDVPIDILKSVLQGGAACIENADQRGLGHSPTSILQRKNCFCIDENIACTGYASFRGINTKV